MREGSKSNTAPTHKIGSLKMYYLKYLIGRKQAGKNDEFF